MAKRTETRSDFYYKKNRFQQLRGFYYTVHAGSVSEAARHMHLTQSTVTLQIQALEEDLGVKLFTRHRQGITLTAEGSQFYTLTAPHIQGVEGVVMRFREQFHPSRQQRITIIGASDALNDILPEYVLLFRKQYPAIAVVMQQWNEAEAVKQVLRGDADMWVTTRRPVPDNCAFFALRDYVPVVFLPPGHPLAHRKKLLLKELEPYPLIRTIPGPWQQPTLYDKWLATRMDHSMVTLHSSESHVIQQMVIAGMGAAIGFVSQIVNNDKKKEIIAVPLSDPLPMQTYGIVVKKERRHEALLQSFLGSLIMAEA